MNETSKMEQGRRLTDACAPLPAITDLIPHRGSMLLVQALESADELSAHARTHSAVQTWYSKDGTMPAWIGLEVMAQTIAAHVGLTQAAQGRAPKQGVLLGTRRFQASVPAFSGELQVEARLDFRDDTGLGAYDCALYSDGLVVATAMVKVFEPADFAEFLASQGVQTQTLTQPQAPAQASSPSTSSQASISS